MPHHADDKELEITLLTLFNKLEKMETSIDNIEEGVGKLTNDIYNPETGLYTRVKTLEHWHSNSVKITWVLISTIIVLFCNLFYTKIIASPAEKHYYNNTNGNSTKK